MLDISQVYSNTLSCLYFDVSVNSKCGFMERPTSDLEETMPTSRPTYLHFILSKLLLESSKLDFPTESKFKAFQWIKSHQYIGSFVCFNLR